LSFLGEANQCSLYVDHLDVVNILRNYDPNALVYAAQKQLPIGSTFKVKVTSIDSPLHFFVSILDSPEFVQHTKLLQEFQSFDSCKLQATAGNACCIRAKGKNYRGIVINELVPRNITCQLVDSGHIDVYNENEIKVMVCRFTSFPPLAYKCALFKFDNSKLNSETYKSFKNICANNPSFLMKIKAIINGVLHVTLEASNKKYIANEILKPIGLVRNPRLTHGVAVRIQHNNIKEPLPKEPLAVNEFDWSEISEQSESAISWSEESANISSSSEKTLPTSTAVIKSVVSPTNFTIQLCALASNMESFLNFLQELGDGASLLTNFDRGERCIARSPYTNEWFRALIIDATFENSIPLISVQNVDDGCSYSFDKLIELKKYPIECIFQPDFGVRCALPVKVTKAKEKDALDFMLKKINKIVTYKPIYSTNSINIVDLFCEGKSFVNELVQADCAMKLRFIPNGKAKVTHIESLNEFYVQLEEDADLKRIQTHVLKYKRKPIEGVPRIGMLVMARNQICCPKGCWHRAQVLSRLNDELVVKSLDYGNTMMVHQENIGAIEVKYAKLDPVARRCTLFLPNNLVSTDEAVEHFKKIAMDKDFGIQTVRANVDNSVVQLTSNDLEARDISDEIIPLCEKTVDEPFEVTNSVLSTISEEEGSISKSSSQTC
jgi:hypothetical protein